MCAFKQKKSFEYGIRRITKQKEKRKKNIFSIGLRESMKKNREKQPKKQHNNWKLCERDDEQEEDE